MKTKRFRIVVKNSSNQKRIEVEDVLEYGFVSGTADIFYASREDYTEWFHLGPGERMRGTVMGEE